MIYIPDEGGGGAYFLDEAGNLCHAPFEGGRYDWDNATQIDHYDIIDPDPGWDYARWARDRLAEAAIDKWEEEHRSEPPREHAIGCEPEINCECEP